MSDGTGGMRIEDVHDFGSVLQHGLLHPDYGCGRIDGSRGVCRMRLTRLEMGTSG